MIAPASWRLPPELRKAGRSAGDARALARWRRAAGVPRMVQVGEGDELYPVDLQARRRRRRSGRARAGVRDLAAARRHRRSRRTPRGGHRRGRRRGAVAGASPRRAPAASRRRRQERAASPAGAPSSCSARPRARTPCSPRRSSPTVTEARARRRDRRLVLPALPRRPRRASSPSPARPRPRRRRAGGVRAAVAARARVGARRRHAHVDRDRRLLPRARAVRRRRARPPFTRSSSPTARRWSRSCRRSGARPDRDAAALFDALARGLGLDLAARHALSRAPAECRRRLDPARRRGAPRNRTPVFRHHARPLRAALAAAAPPTRR